MGSSCLMLPTSWLQMWGARSRSVILSVLTPDEKARLRRRHETPPMLWFAASCWRGSAQALSVRLVPSPGVPIAETSLGLIVALLPTWHRWIHNKCIHNNTVPASRITVMWWNNMVCTQVCGGYDNISFVFVWVASCYYCELTSIAMRNYFLRDNKASAVGLISCSSITKLILGSWGASQFLCVFVNWPSVAIFIQCHYYQYCAAAVRGGRHIKEHIFKARSRPVGVPFQWKRAKGQTAETPTSTSTSTQLLCLAGSAQWRSRSAGFLEDPRWNWQTQTKQNVIPFL